MCSYKFTALKVVPTEKAIVAQPAPKHLPDIAHFFNPLSPPKK